MQRVDVSKSHPEFIGAEHCGFLISGKFPTEFWDDLFLDARLEDNKVIRVHVNPTLVQRQSVMESSLFWPRLKRLGTVLPKLSKIPLYLLHGDIRGLVSKIRKQRSEYSLAFGTPRLNVADLRLTALQKRPVSLIIDHDMGGGANFYRENLVAIKRASGEAVLLFYYSLPTLTGYLKVVDSDIDRVFRIEHPGELLDIVRAVRPNEVFVNNLVSVFDPYEMVDVIKRLRYENGIPLTIATHDYFAICPSWTLLDHKGKFCGIPDISQCRECLAQHKGFFTNLVGERDIERWRRIWGGCFEMADRVLCFSQSSAQLLKRAYPKLEDRRVVVAPHNCDYISKRAEREMVGSSLHVGIIGEIAQHKGSRIVAEMAETIRREQLPVKITVIGTVDDCCDREVVRVTGPYRREELAEIIDREAVNVGFVPSVWPETFSYVTEELIRLAMPIAVFDLGAQAERVRAYSKGLVIKETNARRAVHALLEFYGRLKEVGSGSPATGEGQRTSVPSVC
jgi:glycosyltransferase involved in cell wall biosynthesis